MLNLRGRRPLFLAICASITLFVLFTTHRERANLTSYLHPPPPPPPPEAKVPKPPQPLAEPDWTPPPIPNPFPSLSESSLEKPPKPPAWNTPPEKPLWETTDLGFAPPLLIGFTRGWPLLLQAVVSYIAAGWPADQIIVVENTGVFNANADGRLSLQNPFYLNHRMLRNLGVRVQITPTRLSFSQLQNYYIYMSHLHAWPQYFWSHQDVVAFSYEDGHEGITPSAGEEGYKNLYELCMAELVRVTHSDERWANKFFAYDHLTLVNREAYEDVGAWDTFIPFYMTDCDMHSRLLMNNWTQLDARAGQIFDVSTTLDDLAVLFRQEGLEPSFTDPNPPAPEEPAKRATSSEKSKRGSGQRRASPEKRQDDTNTPTKRASETDLSYWRQVRDKVNDMTQYKLTGSNGRNTWQNAQRGGQGEPFYYPWRGISESIEVQTEAGREVFRRKWGHRDCDLIGGTELGIDHAWMVEKDWE